MTNVYVVYKKTSDSKFYLVKINEDDSVTAIAELTELVGHNLVRILTDGNGNVYVLKEKESTLTYTWHKYNSSGVLQVTKVMTGNEMFGFIASDGYLYTMIFNDDEVHKRSLTDLETAETINLTSGHRFYYLCFDSDGYLYTYDRDYSGEAAFIKWEIGVGISDYHQHLVSSLSAWSDFALLGTTIAHDWGSTGYVGTLATNLSSDLTVWSMDDMDAQVCGVASNTTYWYVLGENLADDALVVEKYNSSKVLQTTITVSSDYITGSNRIYANAITAYPFAVAVYDYPVSPILFPAQHKGTPLRKKCIHFEESMSDVCLNMNNNIKVIREYLQLTYGDTTYPESSNLRDILPSQQLVRLMNKELTTKDYNAIINNFITNISSMFTLINENNRLVKTWLDDYEPDEEDHTFADVKMRPIVVDKDNDEDKLSKVMDDLFEAIEDNVPVLNNNLELLKERF